LEDMNLLFHLAASSDVDDTHEKADQEFLKHAVSLFVNGEWPGNEMSRCILASGISPGQIALTIKEKGYLPSHTLQSAMILQMPGLADVQPRETVKQLRKKLQNLNRKGLLDQLIHSLLMHQQVPFWFASQSNEEAGELLNAIITHYPSVFFKVIKRENLNEARLRWLEMSTHTEELFRSIGRMHNNRRTLMATVWELYQSFANVSIKGISAHELQALLFNRIIRAWTTGNWDMLSSASIWNNLAWDSCLQTGLTKNDFILGIAAYKSLFPVSLQVSMEQYKITELETPALSKPLPARNPFRRPRLNQIIEPALGEGVVVKNAGLVILSSYIPMLFERMGVVSDGKFIDAAAQNDAVHYLQYLVTGASATEEFLLPLNKILCGVDLAEPVTDCVVLTESQEQTMEGLIYGVIEHWPDAGSNSVDGLRGNWIVRNGILRKEETGWDLTVERKSYDLLLKRAPFSFSIIKFPWMPKPLNVTWRL
jgi:hypothetical protein